jgi:CheY-like chemotaxis protein
MNHARLLIVEDEAIVAADLQRQLSRLGYKVEGRAKSGEEAVRLARQFSPDLVLMDVRLIGPMDGIEAARRIYHETGIPIVYMTAYANLIMNDPHQMQPPHLCVAKPFSLSDLHEIIQIALQYDAAA